MRLALWLVLFASPAWAIVIHDNLRPSGIDVPGAAASIQTGSCSTADCTAVASCPVNSVITSAVSREDSGNCANRLNSLVGTYIRLDCYGSSSCSQLESGLTDSACVRVSCSGN